MPLAQPDQQPRMVCQFCGSQIPPSASLCSTCKMFQSNWRNWLPYSTALLTALTLIFTGITYTVTTVRKNLPPKVGLSIISVESREAITVLNTGDTDLLVTAIVFRSDSNLFPFLWAWPTAQIVEERKPKSLGGPKSKQTGGDVKWSFVGGKSETEWQAFLNEPQRTQIIKPQFFSVNSAEFQNMNALLSPLNSLPATATLEYVSAQDGTKRKVDAPVLMVFAEKSESVQPGTKASSAQGKTSGRK
jgi:hypothetical protein